MLCLLPGYHFFFVWGNSKPQPVKALGVTLAQQGGGSEPKAEPPKVVQADQQFAAQFDEYLALSRVISKIEQENGLPKMREHQQALLAKLKEWMIANKVDGWEYNSGTKQFTPKRKEEKK